MPRLSLAFILLLSLPLPAAVTLQSAATMAVQPADCNNLPPAVTTFAPSATAVYLVFVVSGHKAGDVGSVEYITPGGSVYAPASGAWSPVTATEETAARFCFYDDMFRVAGAAPASTPGQWTIRILYNRVLLTTLTFTITASGGGSNCTYTLAPASAAMPASGGVAAVSLSTGSGCTWTAVPGVAWITLMGASSGSGAAVIGYQVQANSTASSRTGQITIGGQTHTVTQAAGASGACTYTLSSASSQIAASGGAGSFTLTTASGCQWNATTSATWIALAAASGTGTTLINYQVQANTTASSRMGQISAGGQVHTVTQAATGTVTPPSSLCVAMFDPGSVTAAATAVSGSVDLRTDAGCSWTAKSAETWLRVTPASGTGTAKLQWSVTANTTLEPRTAAITAGDAGFEVTQSAATPTAAPSISAVVNDADRTAALAPGMRVLVRGTSLAAGDFAIDKPPCLATMAGVSVDVIAGNQTIPAALFSIGPTQLGVQLPYTLNAAEADIKVRHAGGTSAAFRIQLAATAPRIYRVRHEDGSAVSAEKPAAGGAVVDVLMTGLGAVTPALAANALSGDGGALGPAQRVVADVSAVIGERAAEILYAGLGAASAGEYVVRLRIPMGVESGEAPLMISSGAADSPPLPLPVTGLWSEAGSGAIGASGGEVQAAGVSVVAAAGAMPEGTVVRIKRAPDASEVLIEGIPEERAGDVTLTFDLPSAADGETLVAIKEDGYPGQTFLRATVENGRAKVKVPASPQPPADAKAAARAAKGTHRITWMTWVATGWDYRNSPKGLFTVFFDRAKRSELSGKVDMILEGLDRAHGQLGEKVRLSWEARKEWPLEVTIYPFTGSDKNKWGSEGPIRFGKEGQTICLNTNFMTTDKEMRLMVGTAAHELFHVLQNLYDSRFGISIASQGSTAPWVWFEEAASTWFERLVVSEPETYVPTTLSPDTASSSSSDNFAFLKEGLGQNHSQEHGYGASMFLQYLSDELGPETIGTTLKQISRGTPSSNFVDPLRALSDTMGGLSSVAHWTAFCERYFAGAIYGKKVMFPTADLFAGMNGERHVFTGPTDRGKDMSWAAPPLSANVVLLNFVNAGFAADTPLRIQIHDVNHFTSKAHIYRMKRMADGTTTWVKAAEPATAFEFLNAETFGAENESLLIMGVNPWPDVARQKLTVRAGQPKFKNAIIALNGGGSFRTQTVKDGAWSNPKVTVNGNVVTMTNYTTSLGGAVTYSMRARFVIKGALLEKVEYSYRNARAGDVYEYEVELKNVPRTQVVGSFDDDGDVTWFVFTGGADKVVRYYGMRTYQGKEYPQEWKDRQSIEVRLIVPDPE
ncbi:MAG: BACON domain-containing carbohydrate-binding protein [Bryobacteraceae bacterium]